MNNNSANTTTLFPISKNLNKECKLPDRRLFCIQKDEQIIKDDVTCTIKSKGLFLDEISSLRDRSMVLTIQGLLVIYCSDSSGYVLQVRGAKKLIVTTSNKSDTEKFNRIVLKFRFGTIHMYFDGSEGTRWRDAIYSMYHGKSSIAMTLSMITSQLADTDPTLENQAVKSVSVESHHTAIEPEDSPLPSPELVQFPLPVFDFPLPTTPTPHFPVVLPAMKTTPTHTKPYANPVRIYEHAPVNREIVRHQDRPEKSVRTGNSSVRVLRAKLEREAKLVCRSAAGANSTESSIQKHEQIKKADMHPKATPCISTASITLQSPSPSLPSPQDDPINTSILPSDDFFHPVDPSRFFICDDATDPRRSSIYRRGSSAFDYDGFLNGPSLFQDDVISTRSDDSNKSALPIILEESEEPKEEEPVVEREREVPSISRRRRRARFPTMAITPNIAEE